METPGSGHHHPSASGLTDAGVELRRLSPVLFELPRDRARMMRVPARVFADDDLIRQIRGDRSLGQLANVATLPGLYGAALGMPDMHEGYGFPVGGVAATVLPDGIISPGGIGFDINCGVRLMVSELRRGDIERSVSALVHELSRSVPAGVGRGTRVAIGPGELDEILRRGCAYFVRDRGHGQSEDLDAIESGGWLPDADPDAVSPRAKARGGDQLGTLGSGNHFLELQVVDEIYDQRAARAFGLFPEQIAVLIHTGSRGLGHQVCSDFVREMDEAVARYGIVLPDRQLACVPFSSPEGQRYFAAMCAAANFAWCNRQAIGQSVRQVFHRMLSDRPGHHLRLLYDVGHNTAKVERHGGRTLCVHRKGATRAFGPSQSELPPAYRAVGQPVLIPGSMGTASFVLVGTDEADALSFGSSCHGAGRAMSRGAARRAITGAALRRELEAAGIVVRCPSNAGLAEEAPFAYKDVERVVGVVHEAGLARKVARLLPLGVVKG